MILAYPLKNDELIRSPFRIAFRSSFRKRLRTFRMARKSWWFHFKKSIEIYKKSGDKYIGGEANGNRYFERMLDDKLKRYVLNPYDLDIPAHPLWRSWLSYKRKDPPTDEEIQKSLAAEKRLKENANQVFERDLEKFPKYAEKLKVIADEKAKEEKKGFPKYKEYS